MGSSIYRGLTVAYVLGLSQFVMVWLVVWGYLRKSRTDLEPLERRVVGRGARAMSTPLAANLNELALSVFAAILSCRWQSPGGRRSARAQRPNSGPLAGASAARRTALPSPAT